MAEDITTIGELPDYVGAIPLDTTFLETEDQSVPLDFVARKTSARELMNALTATGTIVVKEAADLAGTLDSTMAYYIDGSVDMGSQTIVVPVGGLTLIGASFDTSKLTSNASSYTMFTSPGGGSGNLLSRDIALEVTGASSEVYDLVSTTGFEAFEFARVNWNNCTSLGTITNYRQGLESGTGRFGGTPTLTLAGVWLGGYFIETSIVRSLDDFSGALYQRGTGFSMNSRFRSNQNIDLPASASFFDFTTADFPNPSTVQLSEVIITRNGVSNAGDANITPGLDQTSLSSAWSGNNGMPNTFVGGAIDTAAENGTVINAIGTAETISGTFLGTDLQHFDVPANGQLRHLGNSPREYLVTFDFVLDGTSGDVFEIELRRGAATIVYTQTRVINNLQGVRNMAYFNGTAVVTLTQGQYVQWWVKNLTSTDNCTLEASSQWRVIAR